MGRGPLRRGAVGRAEVLQARRLPPGTLRPFPGLPRAGCARLGPGLCGAPAARSGGPGPRWEPGRAAGVRCLSGPAPGVAFCHGERAGGRWALGGSGLEGFP